MIKRGKILKIKFEMEINRHTISRIHFSVFKNFKVFTLNGAAREKVRACAPERRPWRCINTLYSEI